MPRIARVVVKGYPHHITQRGNYKQPIFIDDADRSKYLSLIQSESKQYGLTVLAFCLMDNHVHFIGIPNHEESMGKVFKYANMKYSQYFNKKMGVKGHLFQGRYYSCLMGKTHMIACARYIERNPVRAKITRKPYNYKWSSAQIHCSMNNEDILLKGVKSFLDVILL